jgi:spermidine synthase
MLSFFRRLDRFTTRNWMALGGGTIVAVSSGIAYEVVRRNRATAVLNDADCVKRVEVARYPCEVLQGYDVVVSNHFYKSEKVSEPVTSLLRRSLLPVWMQEDPEAIDTEFRNGRGERVSDEVKGMQKNRLSSVRQTSSAPSPSASATSAAVTTPPMEWPAGTSRYCGMTIEPSQQSPLEKRGFLRSLVDRSTQQTLVKCNSNSGRGTSAGSTPAASPIPCESFPEFLSAPYLRSMLAVFGLLPQPLPPLRVCFLGVGGGALPMFIQRHFAPSLVRMDLVDVEPQVLTAATEMMGLRQMMQAPYFCHAMDAAAFLRQQEAQSEAMTASALSSSKFVDEKGASLVVAPIAPDVPQRSLYDVIFVDVFVGSETPAHLQSKEFMRSVQRSLSSVGVATFNLPSSDREFVKDCCDVFGQKNVFVASCRHSANNVVFAMKRNANESMSRRHILRRTSEMCKVYRLPYDVSAHFPLWWSVV